MIVPKVCFLKLKYRPSFWVGILHKTGMGGLAVEIGNIYFLKVSFSFIWFANVPYFVTKTNGEDGEVYATGT